MKKVFFITAFFLAFMPCASRAGSGLVLTAAYMCEQVAGDGPENRAVVFSAAEGKIYCFCYFESVAHKTVVYHAWYHRDRLVTRRRLFLQPASRKVYSAMQLRETDKGPWRVDIAGADKRVLGSVRFSVTD